MNKRYCGFTLIELMIVVAIIGILATLAMPSFQDRIVRAQLEEALGITAAVKPAIERFYEANSRFPESNEAAGVPMPGQLIGNYTTGISVEDGGIHIELGNRVNAYLAGMTLALRPAVVDGSPDSPISWLCGYAEPVPGMSASETNPTDIPPRLLPFDCRSWRAATPE